MGACCARAHRQGLSRTSPVRGQSRRASDPASRSERPRIIPGSSGKVPSHEGKSTYQRSGEEPPWTHLHDPWRSLDTLGMTCPGLRSFPRWVATGAQTQPPAPERNGRGRGATGIRTPDLCSAIAALYQLSYSPNVDGGPSKCASGQTTPASPCSTATARSRREKCTKFSPQLWRGGVHLEAITRRTRRMRPG